jgi:hypothetical protein
MNWLDRHPLIHFALVVLVGVPMLVALLIVFSVMAAFEGARSGTSGRDC